MKITDPNFKKLLRGRAEMRDGKLFCISVDTKDMIEEEMGGGINVVKRLLKKYARFYEFLRAFFSPGISVTPHLTPKGAIRRFHLHERSRATESESRLNLQDKVMINVGAGVKPIHPELINIDVYPYATTHIVAEGAHLPFVDNSVDLVICESVIEHVLDPFAVIDEIKRVLKPGGYAYISVPFIYPFHASPNDFSRFTRNALRRRFADYTIVKEGMRAGPATALQGLLMHGFAILLSFGSYNLYLLLTNIFMVLFSPLKLLDLFFAPFPYSHEIAADIYIFVRK